MKALAPSRNEMSGVSATPCEVMQTWGKCGHSGTYFSTEHYFITIARSVFTLR